MLCNCAEEATRNNNGSLSSHAAETTKQTQDFHPKPPTNMSYFRSRQRPHRICHFISVQYFSISLQFSFLRRAGNLSCLATHFWVDYVFDSGGPLQILVCRSSEDCSLVITRGQMAPPQKSNTGRFRIFTSALQRAHCSQSSWPKNSCKYLFQNQRQSTGIPLLGLDLGKKSR